MKVHQVSERTFKLTLFGVCLFGLVAFLSVSAGPAFAQEPAAGDAADEHVPVESPGVREMNELQITDERLAWHLADPVDEVERVAALLDEAKRENDGEAVKFNQRVLDRVKSIARDSQVHLSLEEAIQKALASSYAIEIQSFSPAIETTKVVDAESNFDSVFFTNITKAIGDRATGVPRNKNESTRLNWDIGVRKRLTTGTQVSATYALQRQWTSLQASSWSPEYMSTMALQVNQPLLRGFGLDYNLAMIRIAQNNRRISEYEFHVQVRDRLKQIEELYWALVYARRNVVISSRVLADFEEMYDYCQARKEFDITPVQISATKANLEQSMAEFVKVRADVFDAQDRLLAAMNDPDLPLAGEVEIIPTDFPRLEPMVVDQVAEAREALEGRPELIQQQLRVKSATIAAGAAKNEELPKLDANLSATYNGLGDNADYAWDEMTTQRYIEYYLGLSFEIPIGNRKARAASHQARLQRDQAVASLKGLIEQVILEVNLAVRALSTNYNLIGPSYEAAEAREREVRSIVARAERKDLNTLNSELAARQSLGNARRSMLRAMIEYNTAMIDLERAKGSLLEYYNVVVAEGEIE